MFLLLGGCGGGGGSSDSGNTNSGNVVASPVDGGVLTTPSGNVTVTIPGGTLAKATTITAEQVTVTAVPAAVGASSADVDLANAVAVQLGPAGTTFHPGLPARIKVRLPDAAPVPDTGNGVGMEVPVGLLYLVSADGTLDVPANAKVEVNPATGTVTLAADLAHFSRLEWVPLEGFKLRVTVGAEALPVQTPFPVVAQIVAPPGIGFEIAPTYTDNSVAPVVYNDVGDPTPIPTGFSDLLGRNYQCGNTPLKGTYRATIHANYRHDDLPLGETLVPTRFLVDSHTFTQAVTCFDPATGAGETETRVSLVLPETDSGGIEGGGLFTVELALSAPLDEDLTVPLTLGGTATEGADFAWNTIGGRFPSTTFFAGELRLELEYRALDDNEVDGDKELSFALGDLGERIGITLDAGVAIFTFNDDPEEETFLRGGGMTFSATPAAQTQTVGESAAVTLRETVADGASGHAFVVEPLNLTPDVLGDPVLVPVGAGEGAPDVSLFFDDGVGGFSSGFPTWRLTVDDLATDVPNLQTLQIPCKQVGSGTVRILFKDITGQLLTTFGRLLGKTDINVTCEAVVEPTIEWVGTIGLNWKPEGFGGFLGPRVGTNNEPEGDPFADPTRPTLTMEREILHLDPARDYALVAMHGVEGSFDGTVGVFDLSDGTEVERLRNPLGPTLGAVVLVVPDSPSREPEWLFSYTDNNGYSMTGYNAESREWGMTRFFPGGGVTDIVGGPVDANGRDTGYIAVNAGSNALEFVVWDTSTDWWGGLPGARRTRGRWNSRDNPQTVVSAVGGFDGPALALVENDATDQGQLWIFDPRETDDTFDRLVGSVGVGPRRVRCLSGVCVVTNHFSDSITTVVWTAPTNTPVIVATQAVGAGPVGVDLIPDPAGDGVLALTTGWGANDFTVTRIGADAQVLDSTTTPLPGCAAPGFGHFTDGEGTHVMISCSESNKVVIVPR